MIVWHDYGIWRGVTDALEEMEDEEALGLRNLRARVWLFGETISDG